MIVRRELPEDRAAVDAVTSAAFGPAGDDAQEPVETSLLRALRADVGWIPVLVTAAAYGILNGPLWSAGIAAGIVFALLLTRTRRMGEAVAAHVFANALLCAAVLLWHQWQLW